MKIKTEKFSGIANIPLPIIWIAFTEILLVGFGIYFITESNYIEAILCALLIELRDLSQYIKRMKNN